MGLPFGSPILCQVSEIAAQKRIHLHIENAPVFDRVAAERSLTGKASLLQNPAGGRIVGKGLCKDAQDVCVLKYIRADLPHRLGGDSVSPEAFSEIITELSGAGMDIFSARHADASGESAVCENGKGVQFFPDLPEVSRG